MPESVWNIGFAVSLLLTSCLCILIARGVFRSGVEHFSSRILIFSGIINTSLCGLLFLSQGIYEAIRIATAEPIHLSQLLVPIIFIAVPVRILWNYFSIQQKPVIVYNLQMCTSVEINTKIAALCKTMGINPPAILFSPLVVSPFVFGRRSNRAILAIPEQWLSTNSRNHYIQLLHELSHIRNHDVGFLAWSGAVLQDLQLLLILLPALAGYCFFIGSSYMVSSILLYMVCSIILFAMLRYIVRKRESLADLTAAMLVESGHVKEVINSEELYTGVSGISLEPQAKPVVADKIHRWLLDKAMFSKKQKLWNFTLAIFNFFHSLHPNRTDRLKTIASVKNMWDKVQVSSPGSSFWAGISLGLLGVIIGLGGYWLSMFTDTSQDNTELLHLPFKIYGVAAPAALGFWVIFLTLPYWSSFQNPRLDSKFLFSQLKSHSVALAGACLVCPVILTAGLSDTNIQILTVMCAMWHIFIVLFGFSISIVSVFLWITIRYLQSSQSTNLKKGFLALAPFTVIVAGLVITGIGLINRSMVFKGTNITFSTIMAVVIFLLAVGYSRFSEKDNYFILRFFRFTFLIEGKSLKWRSDIFNIVGCPALLIAFWLPVYLSIDLMLAKTLKNISVRSGLLFLIISSCIILIIIRASDTKRTRELKRTKVYRLSHCLQLLSKSVSKQLCRKISSIAATYNFNKTGSSDKKNNPTINNAYEYAHLVSNDSNQKNLIDQLLSWVMKCQQSDGFGLWPQSSPRLCSTYQAISILNKNNILDKCNIEKHISWLKTLQQPNGSFKGPWSKRAPWEDTFFAVKSLSILKTSLQTDKAKQCENWVRTTLIKKGIEENRSDVVYYCFGTLDALGKSDNETLKVISDWLTSGIEKLLLANVALNYESVHFTVMIYKILCSQTNSFIGNESMALLTERIHIALKAELADIRTS